MDYYKGRSRAALSAETCRTFGNGTRAARKVEFMAPINIETGPPTGGLVSRFLLWGTINFNPPCVAAPISEGPNLSVLDVSTHFLFVLFGDLVSGPWGSIPGAGERLLRGFWTSQQHQNSYFY